MRYNCRINEEVIMGHGEACDDPDCGCVSHRIRRARTRWEHFVHHVVHPVGASIVLLAAVQELWEWVERAAEWAIEHAEHLGTWGGH